MTTANQAGTLSGMDTDTISHTDALNLILSLNCPQGQDGEVITFVLEGHCTTFTVKARLTSTVGTMMKHLDTDLLYKLAAAGFQRIAQGKDSARDRSRGRTTRP